MIRKLPVSTIMTHSVISLKKENNLEDAKYLFQMHHIRHIPIIYDKSIVGMLSKTDLQRTGLWDDEIHNHAMNSLVRSYT